IPAGQTREIHSVRTGCRSRWRRIQRRPQARARGDRAAPKRARWSARQVRHPRSGWARALPWAQISSRLLRANRLASKQGAVVDFRMSSIPRRDFLGGTALAIGAGLTPAAQIAAAPALYPPALTGMRGQHPGSFEVAHALAREGHRFGI